MIHSTGAAMSSTPQTPADSTLFQFLDQVHQRMQEELQHMSRAVDALAQGELPPVARQQLKTAVHWFDTTARQHHLDEEKYVFPALLESGDEYVAEITRRLRQDHGWIEQNWLEIGPLLSAAVGGNHSFDADSLRESVQLFSQLCLDHLVLEESLAYPEARERIAPATQAATGRELASRGKTR
jgi:hemerythrin-like domain-containing protein